MSTADPLSGAGGRGAPGPLRVGYLIDSLVTGGAERLVVTFAEEARRRPELRLAVFVLNDRDTPFRERLRALGVEVVGCPGRSLVEPRRFRRLVSDLRARRIDYLHAHLASSTTLGAPAARLLGIPFATTIHNVRPSVRRTRAAKAWLYRRALRLPGVTRIAVGHAVAEAALADTGGRRCVVVPNAVSPASIAAPGARDGARRALGLGCERVAIAVGAVIGQKAYDDLLAAFAEAMRRGPPMRLLVVGNAPEPERLERLRALAHDLGVADRVRFLGLRTDIPDLLAASDLFVSAAHWEGAPVSLLEAMANGLACAVTDVGDNARILEGTGSRVVAASDPGGLAGAMVELLSDDEARRRIGEAGRARAQREYGPGPWVDRLLGIYARGAGRADLDGATTGPGAPALPSAEPG